MYKIVEFLVLMGATAAAAEAVAACDDGNDSNNVLCRSKHLRCKNLTQKKIQTCNHHNARTKNYIHHINYKVTVWNSFEDAFVKFMYINQNNGISTCME